MRHTNNDGTMDDTEQQYRDQPHDEDDWQDQMRVFYYTTFMAIATHREHPNLDIKWQDLSDFYEKFLFGPTILKRHRRPSLQSIIHAERHAWQHIITEMWDGIPLSTSLRGLKSDTLWWTNELDYEQRTSQWPQQPSYQADHRSVR